jgi:hypothetical protein
MLGNFFGDQWIRSLLVRNISFQPCLKKEQNVEINSSAVSGSQGKYMKYVSFPWPM